MISNEGADIITDVSQMRKWQEMSWSYPRRCLPASAPSFSWCQGSISDGTMFPFGYEGYSAIAPLASFGLRFFDLPSASELLSPMKGAANRMVKNWVSNLTSQITNQETLVLTKQDGIAMQNCGVE
jgi:hypothetical protein